MYIITMAIRQIRIIPDPILRRQADAVKDFGAPLHQLLDDMVETMEVARGLGIAAPQVGVSERVTVIDLRAVEEDSPVMQLQSLAGITPDDHLHSGHLLEIVNPELDLVGRKVTSDEGCLSIPEYRESIQRSERVVVRASDRHGRRYQMAAEGLLCFALQHEIDHLDGVLFTDKLSRLKKTLFLRWQSKNGYSA
jgi:peptide deformylase